MVNGLEGDICSMYVCSRKDPYPEYNSTNHNLKKEKDNPIEKNSKTFI